MYKYYDNSLFLKLEFSYSLKEKQLNCYTWNMKIVELYSAEFFQLLNQNSLLTL